MSAARGMGDGARSVDDYEFRAARCGVIGHPTGCACGRGLLGPATSADLLELDAVPDPVDSDAPAATFGPVWECPEHCGSTGGPHTHGGPARDA